MKTTRRHRGEAALLVLALACCLVLCLSCHSDTHALGLRPGTGQRADGETERLRQMQAIRVINTEQQRVEEIDLWEFIGAATESCDAVLYDVDSCAWGLSYARRYLCGAKNALVAAMPQSSPPTFGIYVVPPQSAATKSTIGQAAVQLATVATLFANARLQEMVGNIDNGDCTPADADHVYYEGGENAPPYASTPRALVAAVVLAEAYHTEREAQEVSVAASLDVADAQRSSTRSNELARARQFAGPGLSRAAATHYLVGGTDGLSGSTKKGFCSNPDLAPDVKLAIRVFRDAAVSPQALADTENIALDMLLNDPSSPADGGTGGLDGSVRMRLAELYSYPELQSGQGVEQYYGLSPNAFAAARQYLNEEIAAFSRSTSAVLPPKTLPGGSQTTYARYAATASDPSAPPAAYYGALARYWTSPGLDYGDINGFPVPPTTPSPYRAVPLADLPVNQTPPIDHDAFIDFVLSNVSLALNPAAPLPDEIRDRVVGPLAVLLSSKERTGRLDVELLWGGGVSSGAFHTWLTVHLLENNPVHHPLRVVAGEDGLRCAVQGSIEGAPCALANHTTATFDPSTEIAEPDRKPGFNTGFRLEINPQLPNGRYYLVQPKTLNATEPGMFEALVGFTINSDLHSKRQLIPIVSNLDKQVADILAPSTKDCSVAHVSCAGVTFDARLPLEDELSQDADGVESSWKRYLNLARAAASLADNLGTDYINAGLANTQRAEEVELRREAQAVRAEEEIAKIISICGGEVDPRKVLELLGEDGGITKASGGPCGDDLCQHTEECIGGRCVVNLQALAESNPNDAELQRLADCLDESTLIPFLSLGKSPLCLWHDTHNPHIVCREKGGEYPPCPVQQPNSDPQCAAAFVKIPPNTKLAATKALGYFDSVAPPATGTCAALRTVRAHPERWSELGDQVRADNTFNPANLYDFLNTGDGVKTVGNRLRFAAKYGGYAEIQLDNSPRFSTGDAWISGPQSLGWPCHEALECPDVGTSTNDMFCRTFKCDERAQRAAANYQMLRAFLAAEAIAGVASSLQLSAPAYVSDTLTGTGNPVVIDSLEFWQDHSLFHRYTYKNGFAKQYSPTNISEEAAVAWIEQNGDPILVTDSGGPYVTMEYNVVEAIGLFAGIGTLVGDWSKVPEVHRFFLAGLSDYRPTSGNGWFVDRLSGQTGVPELKTTVSFRLYNHSSQGFTLGPESRDYLGVVELNSDDFLNGLELLCELKSRKGALLDVAPVVQSLDDLPRASRYIEQLAQALHRQASLMLFSDVPEAATGALRQESSMGSYPKYSGRMGTEITRLRSGFLAAVETVPQLATEITAVSSGIQGLHNQLAQVGIEKNIADVQFASNMSSALASCAVALAGISQQGTPWSIAAVSMGAIATCANSIAQIDFASSLAELQKKNAELKGELALIEFGAQYATHAGAIQKLALQLLTAAENIDGSLAAINGLRDEARVSLARALYLASYQAEYEAEATQVIGNLFQGKQRRYQSALTNARLLSFVAKRAIEQRLGTSLSSMTEDLPLVEAPANWEASVCTMDGLDYNALKTTDGSAPKNFSDGFIGDYVTRLENVVESYRMAKNFHEGNDTTVLSLRDDLMNVRTICDVPVKNLLYNAGQLDLLGEKGWMPEGCALAGGGTPLPDCIKVSRGASLNNVVGNQALSATSLFELGFGPAAQADAALLQTQSLSPGRYRFSWYGSILAGATQANGTARTTGAITEVERRVEWDGGTQEIARFSFTFDLPASADVRVGFVRGGDDLVVGAPMLEQVNPSESAALGPFVNTSDQRTRKLPLCQDTDGSTFRATRWRRDCLLLCDNGFSNNCGGGKATSYCFREATFSLSQSDIQNGKVLKYSGFARGNFNYRIDTIGLNFVGEATKNCQGTENPSGCYAGAYIPYSLYHNGPLYVRNYEGQDFRAYLFDGKIEHARGLAAERFVTNPLSSSDKQLLESYFRTEFQGRPLDGNFVIRVWEEQGLDFEQIQDVQIVLNYRYWTRFK